MIKNTIYLASQSPRRQELLQQLGLSGMVFPAHIDETPQVGEGVENYVIRLAQEKAEACLRALKKQELALLPVLAADTTVCIDGVILGKPETELEAYDMLRSLSGRWHEVHT